jgi:four helix bundle protein
MDRVSDGGYCDLIAWQKTMLLVRAVYGLTESWPQHEQFGLTKQMRRAAVSIPSNFGKVKGRSGLREYSHHLSVAHGSLCELETQVLIAQDLG